MRLRTVFLPLFCYFIWMPISLAASAPTPTAEEQVPEPIKVLQSRYFLKALRPELSVLGGGVINESYVNTLATGGRVGMFFLEWLGLEYTFSKFFSKNSNDLESLQDLKFCPDNTDCTDPNSEKKSVEPSFTKLDSLHGLSVVVAPVYGKFNFFDFAILYSDVYFSFGGSLIKTDKGSKTGGSIGFGQRIYFAKRWSLRADISDYIFMETTENLGNESKSIKNAWMSSVSLSMFLTN